MCFAFILTTLFGSGKFNCLVVGFFCISTWRVCCCSALFCTFFRLGSSIPNIVQCPFLIYQPPPLQKDLLRWKFVCSKNVVFASWFILISTRLAWPLFHTSLQLLWPWECSPRNLLEIENNEFLWASAVKIPQCKLHGLYFGCLYLLYNVLLMHNKYWSWWCNYLIHYHHCMIILYCFRWYEEGTEGPFTHQPDMWWRSSLTRQGFRWESAMLMIILLLFMWMVMSMCQLYRGQVWSGKAVGGFKSIWRDVWCISWRPSFLLVGNCCNFKTGRLGISFLWGNNFALQVKRQTVKESEY